VTLHSARDPAITSRPTLAGLACVGWRCRFRDTWLASFPSVHSLAVSNASLSGNTFGTNITSQFQYYGTPPCPVRAPAVPSPPTQAVGIPAYFAPGAAWSQLNAGAPTVGMAVINPSSGPGAGVNFGYVNQVQQSRARGLVVLGYVHTSYGQRSAADVKREVDQYYAWYDVDGIFLDEASTDCAVQPYYADLNTYVKTESGLARTVLNPGAATNECYMTAADTIVTFEGAYSSYFSNYSAPSWTANYPPNRFWHLVYGVASGNEAQKRKRQLTRPADWPCTASKPFIRGHGAWSCPEWPTASPAPRVG
jgi:hypothetical protein